MIAIGRWFALLIIILIPLSLRAQKQNNIWYLGANAGIDFNGTAAVSIGGGKLNSLEGGASVADRTTGALLFYTDGVHVWDRGHSLMRSNQPLLGDQSSSQAALIVPMPGDSMQYYIFTTDSKEHSLANGLQYAIVNMRLNGGFGDVASGSTRLLAPATEKVTAVLNCMGTGYWVLAHGWLDNKFYSYPVTAMGVGAPVVTSIGLVHQPPTEDNSVGYLKASPDGRKIAVAIRDLQTVQVLDFDAATGVLSNPITLKSTIPNCQTYGLSFSPDNSKLYVSEYFGGVFQYDLSSGNPATIVNSRFDLYRYSNINLGALQLAPDGKIYCAISNQTFLGVVNNPNAAGAACGFVFNGFRLLFGSSRISIPNLIDNNTTAVSATFAGPDRTVCPGDSVTLSASGGTAYHWSPATGLSCTDCPSPVASPAQTTTYAVTTTNGSGCTIADSVTVIVHPQNTVHAYIARDLHLRPDTLLAIPLLADDSAFLSTLDSITFTVRFRSSILRFTRVITERTASEGWRVDTTRDSAGVITMHLTRPAGIVDRASDSLLLMEFAGYIGDSMFSDLALSVSAATTRCFALETAPGLVLIDSICGLENRLIEPILADYVLKQNSPNPFSRSTTIAFSLGLDGPTTLIITNSAGDRVATLLDEHMSAGDYAVTWYATGMPSGQYFYTLTSGAWTATRTMMLVQ